MRFYKKMMTALSVVAATAVIAASAVFAYVPPTSAESACMIDVDTGKILYQVNPNKWIHPASTTKIVTFLTALDKGADRLDKPIKISQEAAATEPSVLGICRRSSGAYEI